MPRRHLAVLTTHPIQYHAPWFRALSQHPQIELEVFYCHEASSEEQAVAGFGVQFKWDVSLLDGYAHRFLNNIAPKPTIHSFGGLDTPEIKKVIQQSDFDAVLINGWHYKSAWQAMRACWNTGTPVIMRSDSHLHTRRSYARQLAKWPFYRWFIPKLDACLPVGSWSRDYFIYYGAHPEKVFIVPHVIDEDFFRNESTRLRPQRAMLRHTWGLDNAATVFLFAGKFIETKRPMDFLRAVARAAQTDSAVTGLMVGDGPLRHQCQEFARINDLPVRFTGFLNQSEISKAYVASDALVLPSAGETWGLVVNEAMVSGLPCFVSDQVGSGPDLVSQKNNGATFSLGDTETLAGLMSQFAADGRSREDWSVRAKQKVRQNSIAAAVEATADVVRTVSDARSQR